MAGQWYVRRGENQAGPFSDAVLKGMAVNGSLLPTDSVWKRELENWHPAGQVRGLFAAGVSAGAPQGKTEGDSTGGVIPYKNPKALIAYYTGIFLSPCCLGFVPLIFGILALQDRAKNPAIKGAVHAYVGIVLGGLSTLALIGIIVFSVIGLLYPS
jgi:hypothetical protein